MVVLLRFLLWIWPVPRTFSDKILREKTVSFKVGTSTTTAILLLRSFLVLCKNNWHYTKIFVHHTPKYSTVNVVRSNINACISKAKDHGQGKSIVCVRSLLLEGYSFGLLESCFWVLVDLWTTSVQLCLISRKSTCEKQIYLRLSNSPFEESFLL